MKYLFLAFAAFGLSSYLIDYKGIGESFSSTANASGNVPIVAELYTSQSCSSCPSADKVLAEIAQQDNIITLGCHVTYWDHLSWKDTLSMPECTNRQKAFNNQRGSNRVYTPQMVINGTEEFVGSRRGQAIESIKNASPLLPVTIHKNGKNFSVSVPNFNIPNELVVEWIAFDNHHKQDIRAGENRGKHIQYSTPVRSIQYDKITDKNKTSTINKDSVENFDNLAVIVRSKVAGSIIAAGKIKL